MTLQEAIEEIKNFTVGCDPWTALDFWDGEYEEVVHVDHAIATIMNAVADGTLITADDVRREALEEACGPLETLAAELRKSENSYHQSQASALLERAGAIRALIDAQQKDAK